jgi:amino acid transporter
MAPVGVCGTLDATSHAAVALVHVVATVAMAFTAFSYAQMVRVVPRGAGRPACGVRRLAQRGR